MPQESAQSIVATKWRPPTWGLVAGLLFLSLLTVLMIYRNSHSPRPANLGVHQGRLSPCPTSPNCVCSQDTEPSHTIAAIPLVADRERQWLMLQQVISQQPRATLVTVQENYLHAEFRSLLFRFVDDVEFLMDADAQVIHIRSASRTGFSDLGVNRKRVDQLRRALNQALAEPSR